MPITDIFQINKIRAELEQTRKERDTLKNLVAETERLSLYEIKQAIAQLEEQKSQATANSRGREARQVVKRKNYRKAWPRKDNLSISKSQT